MNNKRLLRVEEDTRDFASFWRGKSDRGMVTDLTEWESYQIRGLQGGLHSANLNRLRICGHQRRNNVG